MALFYFHVRNELGRVEDEDGIELPDVPAALSEAAFSAHEFLLDGADGGELQLMVTDAAGSVVLKASILELAASAKLLRSSLRVA